MNQLVDTEHCTDGYEYQDSAHRQREELTMSQTNDSKFIQASHQEARQFRVIYMICFLIFLVVAMFGRLLPDKWRPLQADVIEKRSVIGEAKAATNTILPYVFMA